MISNQEYHNSHTILLVGLGNPGKEYEQTRHNVGFMVMDDLVRSINFDAQWSRHDKINAMTMKITYKGYIFFCMKPETFMNESGKAVSSAAKWYNIKTPADIIVIHDDLDIPLGKFKIQQSKSPKDHNGVHSIEEQLGTSDFYRLRIGIENRGEHRMPGEKYVLSKFSQEEIDLIMHQLSDIKSALDKWLLSKKE